MNGYQQEIQLRWCDLDPNFHVRHSVYYDFGAAVRMDYLAAQGLTAAVMQENQLGPILFREEARFLREIKLEDRLQIHLQLVKARKDMSRWTFRHEIWKNGNTLAAILTVDGAWMDTRLRKLTAPPAVFRSIFEQVPRSDDFTWSDANEIH
ncbi:MAG TPA: acyl-CoA thioesterase [Sediminibacterium sp.]|nr:acyl-CoA thioesterase [Sediminibacterium sp.]